MGEWIAVFAGVLAAGALIGLIPFLVGRFLGKPVLGQLGLLCCTLAGLIHLSLPVLLALVFLGWIFLGRRDLSRSGGGSGGEGTAPVVSGARSAALRVICLSGPLRGRSYPIGSRGIMFGRDSDCAVRFPAETRGISRHHCSIRWQGGRAVLTDLNSTYGTFLGDGRQLPPNQPAPLAAGNRFYLADTGSLFQVEPG